MLRIEPPSSAGKRRPSAEGSWQVSGAGGFRWTSLLPCWAWALVLGAAAVVCHGDPVTEPASFRRDIAPVLIERCLRCHDEDVQKGGYRLDTYERLNVAGDSGKAPITPKHWDASHLYQLLVTDDADDRMPQKGEPLDRSAVELFRRWIDEGATFDGPGPGTPLASFAFKDFPLPPTHYPYPVPVAAMAFLGSDVGNEEASLAVGGFREITLWEPTGRMLRRIANVPERLQALVYRAEDQSLLFVGGAPGRAGAAGRIHLGGSLEPQVFLRTRDTLGALAISPDGSRVAVGGTDRGVVLFDGKTLDRLRTLTGHSDWVLDLAFSADGRRLATASRDRTARVFEVSDGSWISAFREHKDSVTAVAFLNGGKEVVTAGKEGRLRTWNADTGKEARASELVEAQVSRLVVRGDRILSAWSDGRIREYRADNLKLIRELGTGGDGVLGLAVSSNSIAAGHHDGRVRLWDTQTEKSTSDFVAAP